MIIKFVIIVILSFVGNKENDSTTDLLLCESLGKDQLLFIIKLFLIYYNLISNYCRYHFENSFLNKSPGGYVSVLNRQKYLTYLLFQKIILFFLHFSYKIGQSGMILVLFYRYRPLKIHPHYVFLAEIILQI